jgi:hypothetical protein
MPHGLLRRFVIAADEQIGVPPLNVGSTTRAWLPELKQEKTSDLLLFVPTLSPRLPCDPMQWIAEMGAKR